MVCYVSEKKKINLNILVNNCLSFVYKTIHNKREYKHYKLEHDLMMSWEPNKMFLGHCVSPW